MCVIMWNTARLDKETSTPCNNAASAPVDDAKISGRVPVPKAICFFTNYQNGSS